MRRILLPVAVLAAVALACSACVVQVSPDAARVDGSGIPTSTLNSVLKASSADAGFLCELGATVHGSGGSSTYDSTFSGDELTLLVIAKAADIAVSRLKLSPTATATALAPQQVQGSFQPASGSSCTDSGTQVYAGLGTDLQSVLRRYQADQDVLAAHLAGVDFNASGFTRYVAAHPSAVAECVSAIVVGSKTLATQLRSTITAGASFAAVAKAKSIDTSSAPSGGAIGCVPLYAFTAPLGPAIAPLRIGQLSEPIAFGTNYVLVVVTQRKPEATPDLVNTIMQAESVRVTSLLNGIEGGGKVTVDPKYGIWAQRSGKWTVVAPSGPADGLLLNPGAVTPSTVGVG